MATSGAMSAIRQSPATAYRTRLTGLRRSPREEVRDKESREEREPGCGDVAAPLGDEVTEAVGADICARNRHNGNRGAGEDDHDDEDQVEGARVLAVLHDGDRSPRPGRRSRSRR